MQLSSSGCRHISCSENRTEGVGMQMIFCRYLPHPAYGLHKIRYRRCAQNFLSVCGFCENQRSLKATHYFVSGVSDLIFLSSFFLSDVDEICYIAPACSAVKYVWVTRHSAQGRLYFYGRKKECMYTCPVKLFDAVKVQNALLKSVHCVMWHNTCSPSDVLTCWQRNIKFMSVGTGWTFTGLQR
jgi:hypothetical protein